jgi:hypothetical protein
MIGVCKYRDQEYLNSEYPEKLSRLVSTVWLWYLPSELQVTSLRLGDQILQIIIPIQRAHVFGSELCNTEVT